MRVRGLLIGVICSCTCWVVGIPAIAAAAAPVAEQAASTAVDASYTGSASDASAAGSTPIDVPTVTVPPVGVAPLCLSCLLPL